MLDATPIARLYARARLRRMRRSSPMQQQERQLMRLLRRAENTRFGRDHGFARIDSVGAFQQRVPLRRYEAFWDEYWRDAFPALADATWPGAVPYLAESSGTSSGKTKYLPISREMVAANKRAALTIIAFHLANRPGSRVLGGKNFMLSGSTSLRPLGPGTWSGDLSGIAAREVPAWARPYYYPPPDLAEIADWEEKVTVLARRSVEEDIRTIGGTASWLLLFFDRLRQLHGRPQGRLADFYPRLELVVYGGVNFAPYRERFEHYLEGSHAELREVYPASEGFLAIADRGVDEGLRLLLDNGLFYEFVPVEELDAPAPPRFWIGDVECGVNYAVILSSCAGVWAYVLGDTVRFVDRDRPRILVTGRVSTYLSAFGEHLTGEEIEKAVAAAADAIQASVNDFTVAVAYPSAESGRGHHVFLVEFETTVPADGVAAFGRALDEALSDLNLDYRAHRAGDFGMGPPEVEVLPPGRFAAWMKRRGKLGGQNKVPRVLHDQALLASLREPAG